MTRLFNKYDKVEHLKPDINEWTLRVRAQALWKGINRQTQDFRGLNVIFIDDSNSRIHAFISAKICHLFDSILKEGLIYTLSNFHVRVYGVEEKNRAVRYEKHIFFANHTQLNAETENVTNIAPYAFDLWSLDDADKFLNDTRFLIDVVGMLKDRNVECVTSKENSNKMYLRFQITDGRKDINVTFFEQFAAEFEKAVKEIKDEPVFVVIASAKVNLYEGHTCLNNYPATRFYLNVEHYSIKQLKAMLLDHNYGTEPVVLSHEYVAPLLTVAEIKKLDKEYIERVVRCQLTVKKVDHKTNWYDNVCTTCGEEVNKVDGRYKCLNCNRNIPYPDKRLRLATICNDNSGLLAIIFPDEEIQRIIGKNAFELENEDDEEGDDKNFPQLLKSFEKKEYIITLTIGEKNVNKTCNIYNAIELNDPGEMLGSHSPSKIETIPIKSQINSMEVDNNNDSNHSPPTGKSSTKARGREKVDNIPYELDENIPLVKFKIPKTEKP